MRLLGLEITRSRTQEKSLTAVGSSRGWFSLVRESFAGAWQKNVEVRRDEVIANYAVFACITRIASDIAKLRVKLMRKDGMTWFEQEKGRGLAFLNKPNHFQTRIQFFENWQLSKQSRGNTYMLKQRDRDGEVIAGYILDPDRTVPLVADDGSIFYQLNTDNLANIEDSVIVPAREIIHDRFNCMFHPLIGLSPIFACGLAATQGVKILNNSAKFFENMSLPGGLLTSPHTIHDDTAKRLRETWQENYSGDNAGRVAVLGDGLQYQQMSISAADAQMVEQLKMSAEIVCSAFHVPAFMVGVGAMPSYNNIEALIQQYYSQCLQSPIEALELLLDEGLELSDGYGTEFDLDGLFRMDTSTLFKTNSEGVKGGWFSPNEARRRVNAPPIAGGDTAYLQQQNYSLAALDKRDSGGDPFGTGTTTEIIEVERSMTESQVAVLLEKELSNADYA